MMDPLTALFLLLGLSGSWSLDAAAQPDRPVYAVTVRAASAAWPAATTERVRRAALLLKSGDPAAARRAFAAIADSVPGFTDWALFLAARAAAERGDTVAVRTHLAATEYGLAAGSGWRLEARAFRAASDPAAAARVFERTLAAAGMSSAESEAAQGLGAARLAAGDSSGARAAFARSIEADPASTSALNAATALVALRQAGAEDRLRAGRVLVRNGRADAGLLQMERYLRESELAAREKARVRLEFANSLFQDRQYLAAARLLGPLARDSVQTGIAGEALVLTGRIQLRQGKKTEARQTLQRAVRRGDGVSADALFILADLEHDENAFEAARRLYTRLIDEHPGSELAADAALRLGGLDFADGRFRETADVIDRILPLQPTPDRIARTRYWAGLASIGAADSSRARGHLVAARDADPISYYGLKAGGLLGLRLADVLGPSPAATADGAVLATGVRQRYELLLAAGLANDAATELDRARARLEGRPDVLYALGEQLNERGRVLDGVRMGRAIRRTEPQWNPRLLRIVYPLPYMAEIVAAARANGLDPFLVAGLIRQESLFDPAARSRAGAVGLMQILPSTGKSLASREQIRAFSTSTLKDPSANVRLGTRFLAELLRRYDGSVPFALAAYNAGPGRLAVWRTRPEAADPDAFAERIPFAETRQYVRTVQQNARIYAELYGDALAPR